MDIRKVLPEDGFDNPYLREVEALVSGYAIISGHDMETLHPFKEDFAIKICGEGLEKLRKKYAWAIPTEDALDTVASVGSIVEVGAGKGYWAMLLRRMGVDIVPYDKRDPQDNSFTDGGKPFVEVFKHDAQVAAAHPDRALFLCWPPYQDSMAARALSSHLKAGGTTLVYIGEGPGDCTADDAFFEILNTDMVERPTGVANVLRWWGCHDHLYVYDRRM